MHQEKRALLIYLSTAPWEKLAAGPKSAARRQCTTSWSSGAISERVWAQKRPIEHSIAIHTRSERQARRPYNQGRPEGTSQPLPHLCSRGRAPPPLCRMRTSGSPAPYRHFLSRTRAPLRLVGEWTHLHSHRSTSAKKFPSAQCGLKKSSRESQDDETVERLPAGGLFALDLLRRLLLQGWVVQPLAATTRTHFVWCARAR